MKSELLAAVERLSVQKIAVVGDVILDRYIWGRVERISPEAPVPVVEETGREERLGGAANVVSNLAGLGLEVDVFGVCGHDEAGRSAHHLLTDIRAGCSGLLIDDSRPTTVKTRILGGMQQMLRLDQEWRLPINTTMEKRLCEALKSKLNRYGVVVISDYGKGAVTGGVLEWLQANKPENTLIVIDPHPENFKSYRGAYLLKPNKKEAEAASRMPIGDVDTAFAAADILLDLWQCENISITLGSMGMIIVERKTGRKLHLDARAKQVFDVSGAGDCVTAVFSACLGKNIDWSLAGELANIAAGIVISEVGTAPITRQKLLAGIEEY